MRTLFVGLSKLPDRASFVISQTQFGLYLMQEFVRFTGRCIFYAYLIMLLCMRTTIEISDELCRQLKRKAADEGVTIRQVVESALRVYLGKQTRRKDYELKWKTERGRILPGVRLDHRDALFDLMDGRR
jgi:Arc/MetJ family transcription regulator